MGFKEKDLLEILDSPNVKSKILQLVKAHMEQLLPKTAPANVSTAQIDEIKEKLKQTEVELAKAKQTIQKYQAAYAEMKQENTLLQNKVQDLTEKMQQLKTQRDEAERRLDERTEQVQRLEIRESGLVQKLQESENAVLKMQETIGEVTKYLIMYRKLSKHSQDSLYNVVCDRNEITFIASCATEGNLKAIWDYRKNIVEDMEYQEDEKILSQIFEYFFDVYNDSLPEPKYIWDDVAIGDYLDDEFYDRGNNSATSGEIKDIILRGFRSKNTGKIIRRSVVRA